MTRPAIERILISVVLPVYNEAGVLPELFRRVRDAMSRPGARQEIIFVDDGSTDGSAELLDDLAADHPQVRVIHLSRNFGHQAAVQAGLAHARGDVVLLMDSDMQDAPEALPRFLAAMAGRLRRGLRRAQAPPGAACGSGFCSPAFIARWRRSPTRRIPIDAGNFSLIDARVVREIVRLGERDRYLPGLRSWVGFRQIGIEVRRAAPATTAARGFRCGACGGWPRRPSFSFSTFPLVVFSLIGYSALARLRWA